MYRNIVYKINKEENWQGEIILYTWDKDGKPITLKYEHNSHFYYEDPTGDYESIYGTKLRRKEFTNSFSRKKFISQHPDYKYYQSLPPNREFLFANFINDNESADFAKFPLRVHFFDIEIKVEDEFPDPYKADYPINLITIYDTLLDKYFTWALPENYDQEIKLSKENVQLWKFKDEKELLNHFINWFEGNYPDVLSGWNSMFFDIPYLINRLEKLLPFDVQRISPVGNYYKTTKMQKQRKMQTYAISGITHLDYLFLYRDKFTFDRKYSYSLDNICEEELGIKKLKYEGTIRTFYKNDFINFIEYNIRDVELLKLLDNKRNLIYLTRKLCNVGLVEYEAVYSSIPYIYNAICINEYKRSKKIFPSKVMDMEDITDTDDGFTGAYVKKPQEGLFDRGVASIDLNSLYPNICIALNLSPETKFGKIINKSPDNEFITLRLKDGGEKLLTQKQFDYIIQEKCTIASNNVLYIKPDIKKGSIAHFLEKMYNNRKMTKKETARKEKIIETYKAEDKEKLTDHSAEIKKLEEEVRIAKMDDHVTKGYLNSVYGMMGCKHSAIFDLDNAEAITLTGQFIIKKIFEFLNNWIKNNLECDKDKEFDIYGDTDSFLPVTLINTRNGTFTIEDIFNNNLNNIKISKYGHEIKLADLDVLTLDNDKIVKYKKAKHIIRHKVTKEKYIIRVNGKEIVMTGDHGCMVMRNNELVRVSAKDILKTDKMVILKG